MRKLGHAKEATYRESLAGIHQDVFRFTDRQGSPARDSIAAPGCDFEDGAIPPAKLRSAISGEMKLHLLPILSLGTLLAMTACDRQVVVLEKSTPAPDPVAQTKTLETSRLGAAVDDYERESSAVNSAAAKKAFAELDGEIAELQEYIPKHSGDERAKAATKLENLQSYRAAQALRFSAAQAKAGLSDRGAVDARSGAEKAEDTARKVGDRIEDAAKKTGDSIEDAAKKTGDAIKDAVR
jgi:hypothetical protein